MKPNTLKTMKEFCSYYTESEPILNYMISRLDVVDGDSILEQCAGNGIFIQKIISSFPNKKYE